MRVTQLDHIVLNVADAERAVRFYTEVLGLQPERLDLWRAGRVPFPSVRVNEGTLIDIFPKPEQAPATSGGSNLNHFCLVLDGTLEPVLGELQRHGVPIESGPVGRWGARGEAQSIYLRDPDGNGVELRTYNRP